MFHIIREMRLQTKFTTLILFICIVPLVIIGVMGYLTSRSTILNQSGMINLKSLELINRTIEENMQTAEFVAMSLLKETELQRILHSERGDTKTYWDEWNTFQNIRNKYPAYFFGREPHITVFGYNGKALTSWNSDGRDLYDYLSGNEVFQALIDTSSGSGVPKLWSGAHKSFLIYDRSDIYISYLAPMRDLRSGEGLGFVVLTFELDEIFRYFGDNNGNYLVTAIDKPELIYQSPTDYLQQMSQEAMDYYVSASKDTGVGQLTAYSDGYTVVQDTIVDQWRVYQFIENSDIVSDLVKVRDMFLTIVLICSVLCLFIGQGFTRKLLKPLQELTGKIRQVTQGNWEVSVVPQSKSDDELGVVLNSFNRMTSELQTLKLQIEKEQRLKSEQEFKVLLAQIHPHFIKNTLLGINGLVMSGQYAKIPIMIQSLGAILTSQIYRNRVAITMADELEYLQHYLNIMKVRYPDKIDVSITVPQQIMGQEIVRFSLQPIVENAIYHGMRSDMSLRIGINARYEGDQAIIEVADNGKGTTVNPLSIERLELQDLEGAEAMLDASGIGLVNIYRRIKLFYGKEYSVSFESKLGEGTLVQLILPQKDYRRPSQNE